jgi:transposase InsO family protein
VIELRQQHSLATLLKIAGLPRSTFYYQAKTHQRDDKNSDIEASIRDVYERHKGRYGYRRITAELHNLGLVVNHKKVQRLMKLLGLKSLVRPKKYKSYRGGLSSVAPNILARQFQANRPNLKWVTDVTEFNVRGDKLYLSPVMDLYNGEIVAYDTARTAQMPLVSNMLERALRKLGKHQTPLIHSDQGWQYQMPAYQSLLRQYGLTQSMSRKGNCLDNASMESFFGVLKSEFFYLSRFESIESLKTGLSQYIHYYNHERIKTKLKGLSPVQYRTQSLGA